MRPTLSAPEIPHTLLEGAKDLSSIYDLDQRGNQFSVLDALMDKVNSRRSHVIFGTPQKTYEKCALEWFVVMISHGIPFCQKRAIDLAPLKVKDKTITIEMAEKVHREESTKLVTLQQKNVSAWNTALQERDVPTPVAGIIVSYAVLSDRSLRILTARKCMEHIFGYKNPAPATLASNTTMS